MFAAAVLGGGLAIPLGIGGGDTAHTVVPSYHSLADNGVINSNGVRAADGGVINADSKVVVKGQHGLAPTDGGVINSNGVTSGDGGVIHSDDDGTINAD